MAIIAEVKALAVAVSSQPDADLTAWAASGGLNGIDAVFQEIEYQVVDQDRDRIDAAIPIDVDVDPAFLSLLLERKALDRRPDRGRDLHWLNMAIVAMVKK